MTSSYRIALVSWDTTDELAESIHAELQQLGHRPILFAPNESLPSPIDVVLTFAPYERWWPIARQIPSRQITNDRPIFVHWNFEGQPDFRLPSTFTFGLASARAFIDRLNDSPRRWPRWLVRHAPLSFVAQRMKKFRYLGENRFATRQKILDLLIESSVLYADRYRRQNVSVQHIHWGTSHKWYAALNLKRDIDVVWLGIRRTQRRSQNLDRVRCELARHGIHMHVIDDIERPFVFRGERIEILNRAKITLNLLPTINDNNFPFRFHQAAGNRSMVVSETFLPHDRVYVAGKHYVSSSLEAIVDTIKFYLEHDTERQQVAENAYQLVTTELTLRNSLIALIEKIDQVKKSLAK